MTLEGWPTVARHAMGVEPWTWLLGTTNLCGGNFLLPIFFWGGERMERDFWLGFYAFCWKNVSENVLFEFVGFVFRCLDCQKISNMKIYWFEIVGIRFYFSDSPSLRHFVPPLFCDLRVVFVAFLLITTFSIMNMIVSAARLR